MFKRSDYQNYFVIYYQPASRTFAVDDETAEVRFPDGLVWNDPNSRWVFPRSPDEQALDQEAAAALQAMLNLFNNVLRGI